MSAETKVINNKFSVLELVKKLVNVSAAYRQRSISQTKFYEYKRRFKTHCMGGLRNLTPTPSTIQIPPNLRSLRKSRAWLLRIPAETKIIWSPC